ncbi:hypothetical protein [Mariniflexile sp. AS56]|uniref:hypothetical protein n=1 Tax=Mariniflexile sp. AS56 TaxID=3063957 RepID=UPI0026ED7294|nr:hypothetical protein [Mariniflexile sp. AS56]MDO7173728.1 hypothetical protein [Mariniflexile sp. AS56]
MEEEFYICTYCYKEYTPNRRRFQKFCSGSCRSKAHHARKTKESALPSVTKEIPEAKTKIDSLSLAGVGNATIGTLAADGVKFLFTPPDKKTATKGDLIELANKLTTKYHLVKNLPPRHDGALPYFSMETKMIIYSLWAL